MATIDIEKVEDCEMESVDSHDYPDFSDAYISAAKWIDTGEQLTSEELDSLNENGDLVNQLAHEHFQ